MEADRCKFLLNRDGSDKTIEFYEQAYKCYLRASELAMKPREDNEIRTPARGKEYAEMYAQSANECLEMIAMIRLAQSCFGSRIDTALETRVFE